MRQTKAAIYQSQGRTFLNNLENQLSFSFLNGHQRSIILSKYFILSLHSLVNVCVQEVSEPTKEEKAVAKYLRFNCPTKSTNMMGHRVDYFIGECFAVFCWCQCTTSPMGGSATREKNVSKARPLSVVEHTDWSVYQTDSLCVWAPLTKRIHCCVQKPAPRCWTVVKFLNKCFRCGFLPHRIYSWYVTIHVAVFGNALNSVVVVGGVRFLLHHHHYHHMTLAVHLQPAASFVRLLVIK